MIISSSLTAAIAAAAHCDLRLDSHAWTGILFKAGQASALMCHHPTQAFTSLDVTSLPGLAAAVVQDPPPHSHPEGSPLSPAPLRPLLQVRPGMQGPR